MELWPFQRVSPSSQRGVPGPRLLVALPRVLVGGGELGVQPQRLLWLRRLESVCVDPLLLRERRHRRREPRGVGLVALTDGGNGGWGGARGGCSLRR